MKILQSFSAASLFMRENMELILSTCGSSIITNRLDSNERNIVNKYSNIKKIEEIKDKDERQLLLKIIEDKRNLIMNHDFDIRLISAEMNGLLTYKNNQLSNKDIYYLLYSDTYYGFCVFNLLKEFINTKYGIEVFGLSTEGLQTNNFQEFHHALTSLIPELNIIHEAYSDRYHILYNLTGGFKSVNAFLQSLSLFFADEVFYLFESSSNILKIPKIPVKSDFLGIFKEHLHTLRKLKLNLITKNEEISDIPDSLIYRYLNMYDLSYWGAALWEKYKTELYSEKILESPYNKIQYNSTFEESSKNLESRRICQINKKIDDLVLYLKSGKINHTKSLDLKKLKIKVNKISDYELDAWHDEDCKRIFCHFSGDIIILDRLDKALH
jgi:putative CRISPR-associated protein (TIGR02619 family)